MNATNVYVTNILSGYFFTNTFKYPEVHHWWTEPVPMWVSILSNFVAVVIFMILVMRMIKKKLQ